MIIFRLQDWFLFVCVSVDNLLIGKYIIVFTSGYSKKKANQLLSKQLDGILTSWSSWRPLITWTDRDD